MLPVTCVSTFLNEEYFACLYGLLLGSYSFPPLFMWVCASFVLVLKNMWWWPAKATYLLPRRRQL